MRLPARVVSIKIPTNVDYSLRKAITLPCAVFIQPYFNSKRKIKTHSYYIIAIQMNTINNELKLNKHTINNEPKLNKHNFFFCTTQRLQ